MTRRPSPTEYVLHSEHQDVHALVVGVAEDAHDALFLRAADRAHGSAQTPACAACRIAESSCPGDDAGGREFQSN